MNQFGTRSSRSAFSCNASGPAACGRSRQSFGRRAVQPKAGAGRPISAASFWQPNGRLPERGARRPDQPQAHQERRAPDPPRRMPAFRPGVGKQNIGPGKRPAFQSTENQPHIIIPDPDVGEMTLLDMAHQTGDAIDEGLGTDKSGVGTTRGDGDEIFPPAKADLEENVRRAFKLWLCRMFGTRTQLWKTLFQHPALSCGVLRPLRRP